MVVMRRMIVYPFLPVLLAISSAESADQKNVYLIGNSLTDNVNYLGFVKLAAVYGYSQYWERLWTPGAPLSYLWGISDQTRESFAHTTFDVMTLQGGMQNIQSDSGAVANFIGLAVGNNPAMQLYMYQTWMNRPDANRTAQAFTRMWDTIPPGGGYVTGTKRHHEMLLLAVRKISSGLEKAILMIPVGQVMYRLNAILAEGGVPGYASAWDLYADDIHLNGAGSYLVGLTFFATIYRADPRGMPEPSDYGNHGGAFVAAAQRAVYETVFTHLYSGTTLDDIVEVQGVSVSPSTLSLPVLQSAALSAVISPANASRKQVTWRSSNTSIAIVNEQGVVTALGAGSAEITAVSVDGAKSGSATVTVTGSVSGTVTTGTLAKWDISGNAAVTLIRATQHLTGISADSPSLDATLGIGLTPASTFSGNMAGINQDATTLQEALGTQEYFSIAVAPEPGYVLTVTKLKLNILSQGAGRDLTVMSSVAGFAPGRQITVLTGEYGFEVPVQGHSNLPMPVEFRVYFHSSSGVTLNGYGSVGMSNGTAIEGSVVRIADSQPPSTPSGLAATAINFGSTTLTWNGSTDDIAVRGYKIYRNDVLVNAFPASGTEFVDTGLAEGVAYEYTLSAVDYGGNESGRSEPVSLEGNRAPTAVISAQPLSGDAPLTVSFTASGSSDPDAGDHILGYQWNFGDGSAIDITNAPSHTYQAPGTYTVTLRVMDNRNLYSLTVSETVVVGGSVTTAGPVRVSARNSRAPARVWTLAGRYAGAGGAATRRATGATVVVDSDRPKLSVQRLQR